MPVFNFDNGVDGFTGSSTFVAPFTLTYTDDEYGGVVFTLSSSDATPGNPSGAFINGTVSTVPGLPFVFAGFSIFDKGNASTTAVQNVFTLKFDESFNGLGTLTTLAQFVLGGNVLGAWQLQPTLNGADVGPGPISVTSGDANGTVTLLPLGTKFNGVRFTSSGGTDTLSVESFAVNCFCAGTAIAMADKSVKPVEALRVGDRLARADGSVTRVRWVGEQPVNVRLSSPAKFNPICIGAGALAEGVPARDLYVSPDHAIAIDGMLINAGALVNGATIYQVAQMPLDGFTYYHVETDAHELILAEGCAAESYLDIPDRSAFINGSERADAPPIPEMDLPRISAARLVPAAIRARLNNRSNQCARQAA